MSFLFKKSKGVKVLEKIGDTIEQLSNNLDFQKRYEQLRAKVLKDPFIRQFLLDNKERLTEQIIERSIVNLYEYMTEQANCTNCPGLRNCPNIMGGYRPKPIITTNSINLEYEQCPLKIAEEERRQQEQLIDSIYVPRDILKATFTNFDIDKGRIEASKLAYEFVDNYETNPREQGIYFYGQFGVGKSYLLGAIANKLAEKGVSSMIVYVPEFVREMKSAIGDQTLDEKLAIIKKAPILMLDDIGAESMSSWVRDEIFGTVLQYRMLENLPTFFTSNFNYEQLEHHLAYNQRGDEEKIKAARILERIKYLSKPVLVDGPNRRNQ